VCAFACSFYIGAYTQGGAEGKRNSILNEAKDLAPSENKQHDCGEKSKGNNRILRSKSK